MTKIFLSTKKISTFILGAYSGITGRTLGRQTPTAGPDPFPSKNVGERWESCQKKPKIPIRGFARHGWRRVFFGQRGRGQHGGWRPSVIKRGRDHIDQRRALQHR